MELFAFLLIAGSLFIWSVLFLIECGVAMLAPWAERFGGKEPFAQYLKPIWETTNVFLVFAFVALIAFFPSALATWADALAAPFFFFLAAMGIRALGMILAVYSDGIDPYGAWLLALGGFLSPVIFATSIFPYFLFGTGLWTTDGFPLAITLALMAISLALFLASTLFHASKRRRAAKSEDSYRSVIHVSFLIFALTSVAGLMLFGPGLVTRMPLIGVWYLVPLSAVFIADLGAVMLRGRRDLPEIIPFGFGVITLGMLAGGALLAQMPYLIYGRVTVYDAFTDPAVARMLFIAFGVGAAITFPALIFLFAARGRRGRAEG